ncbi:metal-dependent hydrolase [Clostridium sp.]|uniref:metal-dependent hydrolase n=1 Tax=Clostridium sp. TaxID=1506 RepID=UPI0032174136
MTKQTHSSGGFLVALLAIYPMIIKPTNDYTFSYQILLIGLYFYSANMGALFPDIDLKSSYISKRYPFIAKYLGKKCRHRGFTHSLLFLLLLYLLCLFLIFISQWNIVIIALCYGFLFGYASHLFLDILTHQGIKLFFPVDLNIHILSFKTNSAGEKIFSKILKIFTIILILNIMYKYIYLIY